MWAVVGLGNPGRRYSHTRHNVGFEFVKRLSERWGTKLRKRRYHAKVAGVDRPQGKVLLALPQTFMNSSGLAVQALVAQGGVPPGRLIVAYDDFDLPLGEIRIRKGGSAGSHKGMASIIHELGTAEIARIRFGIGPLPENADPVEFVLSALPEEERPRLEDALDRGQEALELILEEQIEAAMNRFNVSPLRLDEK